MLSYSTATAARLPKAEWETTREVMSTFEETEPCFICLSFVPDALSSQPNISWGGFDNTETHHLSSLVPPLSSCGTMAGLLSEATYVTLLYVRDGMSFHLIRFSGWAMKKILNSLKAALKTVFKVFLPHRK